MAGEQTAKFYESLTAVIVRNAIKKTLHSDEYVYREVKLPGVSIRSDVIVGASEALPSLVFFVTHSNLLVDWNKKFKRDAAEYLEIALSESNLKGMFLVLFDNSTMEGIDNIIRYTLNGVVVFPLIDTHGVVESLAHDSSVLKRLEGVTEIERQKLVLSFLMATPSGRSLFKKATENFKNTILSSSKASGSAKSYFAAVKEFVTKRRKINFSKRTRNTRYNRGISKLGLFDSEDRKMLVNSQSIEGPFNWATLDVYWPINNKEKGQLLRSVGKNAYRCVDPEVLGGNLGRIRQPIVVESPTAKLGLDEIGEIIDHGMQPMSSMYLRKIKSKRVMMDCVTFLAKNHGNLSKKGKLGRLLMDVFDDPVLQYTRCFGVIPMGQVIDWNWLYTGIISVLKASKNTKQGFGQSKIARLIKDPAYKKAVGSTVLKNLESRISRLDDGLVLAVGDVLADSLRSMTPDSIQGLAEKAYRFMVLCEVEDKFIPNGIDVLNAMIERAAKRNGIVLERQTVRSCLAVAAEAGGIAGTTRVYRSGNTIIWYKASHLRQNVLHKRKEIQSTVASWRQRWDSEHGVFVLNTDIKKTILVIDGDWEEGDLKLLHAYGWDEFLYPDELDRLPDLIV